MKININEESVTLTEEQVRLYRKMTKLQQDIVRGKLLGMNNVEAYKSSKHGRAKSDATIAVNVIEILKNPKVAEFMQSVDEHLQRAVTKELSETIMTREEMAARLTAHARGQINDVVALIPPVVDEVTGEILEPATWTLKPFEEMTGAGLALISELASTKEGVKVKTHDQLTAMKQLAALLGYEKPIKIEQSGIVESITQIQIVAPDQDVDS